MATRCVTTSSASAFSLWILAQRAIWFRFEPIRYRQRSSSTRTAATAGSRMSPCSTPVAVEQVGPEWSPRRSHE